MNSNDTQLFQTIERYLKDIEQGGITEKEVAEYMKGQGQDWQEIKTAYQNMKKISRIAYGK